MLEVILDNKTGFFKTLIVLCFLILFSNHLFAKEVSQQNYQKIAEAESIAKELSKQWNGESFNRSIAFYLLVSNQWKEIGEFEKASDCLREVSNLYTILGKNEEAINILHQVQLLDKKHNNPPKVVKTLSLIAIATLRLGKIVEARNYSTKALKISETTNDFDSMATAFFTQALINYDDGEFKQATVNFEKALSWWKNDNNLEGQAKTLLELAYAYMTNDELLVGLEKAQESLSIASEIKNLQIITLAQNAMGVLKSKLGKKQEALNIFTQAEKQFPDEVNSLEKGDMFNHLAGIYFEFNDLQLALKYRLKALEIFRKEKNPFAQLATLSKLGIITFKLGNENKALEYFNEGFRIAEKVKSEYYYSVFAQDLGNLYFENDKLKALYYYEVAQKHFEKVKIRTHTAIIQSQIGMIYLTQNRLKLAKDFINSSLRLNRETKNKFAEAQNLFQLSIIHQSENNPNLAFKLANQFLEITESLYSDVANSNLKRSYFSNVYDRYELYIHLLMQKHKESPNENFAIQALQASEKSRSRSLLEILRLSEANFTKDASPELVKKEKELRNLLSLKADKLTELLSGQATKEEINKVEDEIRTLENDLETVKAELKQNSPVYSAIKNPPPFDVAEFQQNVLDDKTLLLEFSLGEKESYLWLIGKNEVFAFVLPARQTIENRIEEIRQTFDKRQLEPNEEIDVYQKRMVDLENIFNQEAKLLSQDLLGQVIEKIKDKRLIVVPDGKLQYLPLSALPTPNSDEPLIARNEIIYEPSASTLNLLAKFQTSNKLPSKDLLVFADPVFSEDDARLTNKTASEISTPEALRLNLRDFRLVDGNGKIPRLFASQEEANSIVNTIGKSRATMAIGYDANRERALNADISDYRILHFATHGLIDVERPEVSSIVLSQFDETGNKREGFLRLQDIYAMNLASDLVVLSACQSGIGKEIKGEGLMSLNNAFLQAGAKSVLSSAWKVDDNATAELMKNFYANLSDKGLTASEALRQAQLSMSKTTQFKSPFYWAAFTVQGEFRQPISFSSSYFYHLIFAVIVLLVLAFFWRRKFLKVKTGAQARTLALRS